jgi:DNA-binding MarR family transcriptional regulator
MYVKPGAAPDVERDLLELVRIMPQALRGLKRAGPDPEDVDADPALRQAREQFTGGALGPRHLPVLVALALEGTMSVGDVARRVGLGVPATSLMIGELDRAEIVERRPDEQDRRRTVVSIRAPHAAWAERLAREKIAPLRRALERMGPETRAGFLNGWRVLAQEVGETTSCSDSPAA